MSETPHATPDAEPGHAPHAEEEVPHHLSPWPLVSAIGGTLLAVGIFLHPLVAFVGALVTLGGVWGWVREDMHFYHHPVPELFHHGHAPNPLWGVILFLGTEVILFGALFASYFNGRMMAHHAGEEWPGVPLPLLATGINTAILISSGGTMHWAMHSIQHGRRRQFLIGLSLTLLLGATFLFQQVREYIDLIFSEGLTMGENPEGSPLFGSTFFSLTGTHGLHVFGGLVAIFFVFFRALKGQFSPEKFLAVEGAAFYWHFVDVVWVFLFVTIYLGWI